jgi:hypothetical protein
MDEAGKRVRQTSAFVVEDIDRAVLVTRGCEAPVTTLPDVSRSSVCSKMKIIVPGPRITQSYPWSRIRGFSACLVLCPGSTR